MTIRQSAALGVLAYAAVAAQAQRFELAKLEASDGQSEDYFGAAVAIEGPLGVVGAPAANGGSHDSGTIYAFDLGDPRRPVECGKLLTHSVSRLDRLGCSVAVRGDRGVAGAASDDEPCGDDCGSAHLFYPPSGGVLAKFIAPDCAAGDQLGHAVAITDEVAIAGAPGDDNEHGRDGGAVYLFDTTYPDQAAVIRGSGAFGSSVAAEGSTLVVGAPDDDAPDRGSGSASIFDISDPASPVLVARLVPDDGAAWDHFGYSVAISGSTVLVGAPWNEGGGSVYVFSASGEQVRKLRSRTGGSFEEFGTSVAASGDLAIIGAPRAGDLAPGGIAYLFDLATGRQVGVMSASDAGPGDELGVSVAVHGRLALAGAHLATHLDGYRGAAYLFSACPPDLNGDGVADSRDLIEFLIDWAERDLDADWDGGGAIDSRDFIAFLNDWAAGCGL